MNGVTFEIDGNLHIKNNNDTTVQEVAMKILGSLLAKREKVMKSVLRLRLESIRDAVREREKTVTLPQRPGRHPGQP